MELLVISFGLCIAFAAWPCYYELRRISALLEGLWKHFGITAPV